MLLLGLAIAAIKSADTIPSWRRASVPVAVTAHNVTRAELMVTEAALEGVPHRRTSAQLLQLPATLDMLTLSSFSELLQVVVDPRQSAIYFDADATCAREFVNVVLELPFDGTAFVLDDSVVASLRFSSSSSLCK